MHDLGQNAAMEVVLDATDIGGTNATSKYVDLSQFNTVTFFVTLGQTLEGTPDGWNAADRLDTFKLREATDAAGTSVADISGTVTAWTPLLGAAGDTYYITMHASALDGANDKVFVAAYVEEDDNTGVDFVSVVACRYNARYKHDDLTSANHLVIG